MHTAQNYTHEVKLSKYTSVANRVVGQCHW